MHNQTRDQVLWHMRGSLATLHLNKDYPETFGCVNAESNMVETPVLCYNIGATKEILYNPDAQLVNQNPFRVDLNELATITETIFEWHNGKRPKVKLNPIFNQEKITKKWIDLL